MSDPQILIVGGRPRGRPRATVPRTHLTARVPTAYVDRLAQLALKHDVSVSVVLCQVLQKAFDMPRPPRGITEHNK